MSCTHPDNGMAIPEGDWVCIKGYWNVCHGNRLVVTAWHCDPDHEDRPHKLSEILDRAAEEQGLK